MFGLGPWELTIIFLIVLIIFGANKLPEIGSGMGKAIKNFKTGISDSKKKEPEKKIEEGNNT